MVASNADFFGLHLTNFGCGADSFLEHFYRHIMGDKAYMILELDEHSAVAGVMTRLEAYKNVIFNSIQKARQETRKTRASWPIDHGKAVTSSILSHSAKRWGGSVSGNEPCLIPEMNRHGQPSAGGQFQKFRHTGKGP